MLDSDAIGDLVRPDRVHRSIYTDPEIFRLEQERIFAKAWLFVGHESQAKAQGDFFTAELNTIPIVAVRDHGQIKVFFNRCSHRGAKVCQLPEGNAKRFVCPYHGWTFANDGALVGVPLEKGFSADFQAERQDLGLKPVPRTAVYRGFVFASLAAEGPELAATLGPIAEVIDNLVDRAPDGEVELTGGVQRHYFRGNWKLLLENLQDYAHPTYAHESSIAVAREAELEEDREFRQEDIMAANGADYAWIEKAGCWAYPGGHSFVGALPVDNYVPADVAARYRQALEARVGPERAEEILSPARHIAVIWPTLAVHPFFRQVKFVEPITHDLTRVSVWCLKLKGAPEEYHRATVAFLNSTNGAGSLILTDDLVLFERAQASLEGGQEWVVLANGYGQDHPDNHGGMTGPGYSELPMRNQYVAWREYMAAEPAR